MIVLVEVNNAELLDNILSSMNENGYNPDLPFIDANSVSNIAHGTAPSGDDWLIQFEGPRDPDSGSIHCCECYGHNPVDCDAGAMWEPKYPITVMVSGKYAEKLLVEAVGSEKADADETGTITGTPELDEGPTG